jgi:hypothetical protein
MIRMIANNTSDYVATDLIHNLWCQHDEKYGCLFTEEGPHQSKTKCLFEHTKKFGDPSNYASFGQVYEQNHKEIKYTQPVNTFLKGQEYFGIDPNGALEMEKTLHSPFNDENTVLIRKRESNANHELNSTKV